MDTKIFFIVNSDMWFTLLYKGRISWVPNKKVFIKKYKTKRITPYTPAADYLWRSSKIAFIFSSDHLISASM